jgi:undecaprenyl diphosphate synthase
LGLSLSEDMMDRVPSHVGIIMDGNGRWAQERGLPRIMGHHAGVKKVEVAVRAAKDLGIRYLSLYAFSSENWKRGRGEVGGLMGLFRYYIKMKVRQLREEGGRLLFAGSADGLPDDVREIMAYGEQETRHCSDITLVVCLNYGGRREILDAVGKAVRDGVQDLDEETFRRFLYLPDLPDPDLIIRTGGEMRISNFWLFQCAYSELYFSPKYWPDFDRDDLVEAVMDYVRRDRRYGGVKV